MKEPRRVSELMLERYRLGEVSASERELVEAELSLDGELKLRYKALEVSDLELRSSYPWEQLKPAMAALQGTGTGAATGIGSRRLVRGRFNNRLAGICAAAVLLCVLFPSLYYLRGRTEGAGELSGVSASGPDRIKGTEIKTELSVYLKDARSQADGADKLPDRTPLRAGNTVQLAYITPPGEMYYGVIFSIDGRSELTVHYPYRNGQSPVLTAGKRTFLAEAYTLDDAPDFEIFFMVVSRELLDTERVLKTARELARDPGTALQKSAAAFTGCEVETVTIQKQK